MPIHELNFEGGSSGLQVVIPRPQQKGLTKFFAFRKHGGKEATWRLAIQVHDRMYRTHQRHLRGLWATRSSDMQPTAVPGLFIGFHPEYGLAFSARPEERRGVVAFVEDQGACLALQAVLRVLASAYQVPVPDPRDAWDLLWRAHRPSMRRICPQCRCSFAMDASTTFKAKYCGRACASVHRENLTFQED